MVVLIAYVCDCLTSGLAVLVLVVASWYFVFGSGLVNGFLEDFDGVVRVFKPLDYLLFFNLVLLLGVAYDEGA